MNRQLYRIGLDGRPMRGLIGIDGEPIERTPETHPYSYDAFFEYMAPDYQKTDKMVYHDRMMEWNRKAFRDAVATVWPEKAESQMFYGKVPEKVEKFLSLYFGKAVRLTGILRGCNVSNGYPYWIFCYREVTA